MASKKRFKAVHREDEDEKKYERMFSDNKSELYDWTPQNNVKLGSPVIRERRRRDYMNHVDNEISECMSDFTPFELSEDMVTYPK